FGNAPTISGPASTSEFSDPVPVVGVPTAAGVSVAGRVTDALGNGLRNTTVTMTDLNGRAYRVQTNAYGDFSFAEIPSGQSYIVGASRKGYAFDSFMMQVSDSVTGVTIAARQ
ncbi:MAG TPA: carboxypeptidase-like regulatory domain-containing protein, partial [Pyrinomonadaceae bacterium]|nr:carboxypeptidase-like regulatory domain-containing protein [Pyrinomonadaceae bacterium]